MEARDIPTPAPNPPHLPPVPLGNGTGGTVGQSADFSHFLLGHQVGQFRPIAPRWDTRSNRPISTISKIVRTNDRAAYQIDTLAAVTGDSDLGRQTIFLGVNQQAALFENAGGP